MYFCSRFSFVLSFVFEAMASVNYAARAQNAMIDRWNAMAGELRVIHRHLRRGAVSRALRALVALLDSLDLSDDESGYESDAPGDDEAAFGALSDVADGNAPAVTTETGAAPAAFSLFTGRGYRLDD